MQDNNASASPAACSGQGSVTPPPSNSCSAGEATVTGKGQIIHPDGKIVDFIVTSDPLTPEQDEWAKSNLKKTEE